MKCLRSRKNLVGFTLIEVLVAIAVIAFVVPSLMLLMMQQTNFADTMREKSIAHWIAENKATELRLKRTFLQQLLQRESTETVEMADIEWTVDIDIEQTAAEVLVLYRIKVSREDGEPVVTLDTYLDKT